ncbi:MAG: hypothetical protein J6A50_04180 [Clostridia bacterium]|nr:hypothetical protein [Clostridia bacterium]
MKALVLAGEEGARLRPITAMCSVAMTEILGVPFIDIIMKRLAAGGVKEVLVLPGYMPGELCSFLEDGSVYGFRELGYMKEGQEFEEGFFIDGQELLIVDAAVAENIDYEKFFAAHRENRKTAEKPEGTVTVSRGAAVLDITEGGAFAKKLFRGLRKGESIIENIGQLFPGRLFEWAPEGYTCRLETPRDYLDINLAAARGEIKNDVKAKYGEVTIGFSAAVSESARLSGTIYIGENCIIGKNVIMKDCVVGDGCVVGEGASLVGCVLLKNARIGAGCKLKNSVICGQSVFAEGVFCEDCVVGSGAVCGENSIICKGVRLWPSVVVEPESVVRRSIIGGKGDGELIFKEQGIDGNVLTRRMPAETMTRLGCAVGSVFGYSSVIIVCSNDSGASRMLSSAVASGLLSVGAMVRTAVDVELPVIRWVCRNGAADGAVYIDNSGELTISLLDKHGNDLPRYMRKQVRRAFSCEEFSVVDEKAVLSPEALSDPEDYYVADIGKYFPYAYREFRMGVFNCGRERREAIAAYITGKLYPEAPVFVSVNSALSARHVADKLKSQVIKCGGRVGDVMEAMEPFMKLPGVYQQYLMLFDDYAFELALCHFKAVTGEAADSADNPLLTATVIKKHCTVACNNMQKGQTLRKISREFSARFGDKAERVDGLFSWDEQAAVRITADERRPVFNISVESFDEEYAVDMMNGLSAFFG